MRRRDPSNGHIQALWSRCPPTIYYIHPQTPRTRVQGRQQALDLRLAVGGGVLGRLQLWRGAVQLKHPPLLLTRRRIVGMAAHRWQGHSE